MTYLQEFVEKSHQGRQAVALSTARPLRAGSTANGALPGRRNSGPRFTRVGAVDPDQAFTIQSATSEDFATHGDGLRLRRPIHV